MPKTPVLFLLAALLLLAAPAAVLAQGDVRGDLLRRINDERARAGAPPAAPLSGPRQGGTAARRGGGAERQPAAGEGPPTGCTAASSRRAMRRAGVDREHDRDRPQRRLAPAHLGGARPRHLPQAPRPRLPRPRHRGQPPPGAAALYLPVRRAGVRGVRPRDGQSTGPGGGPRRDAAAGQRHPPPPRRLKTLAADARPSSTARRRRTPRTC